ncbi:MAG: chorismate mutase [Bauldia sp.]|nr:chorismate mutase [Bauldia sp.]
MSAPANDTQALVELRQKIDAIDAEIHRLLIDRGAVVDSLIRIKGTSNPANAFRPGREAWMMRRLVAGHEGALPVTTVEHIWREIITTFTRLQAPFDIAVDMSSEPQRMQDVARFYFGFSVKVEAMPDAAAVVARVGRNTDLGLVAIGADSGGTPWWRGLVGADTPRIMSHVPFIRTAERPADLPALVISPPLADPTPPEVRVAAILSPSEPVSADGVEVLATCKTDDRWDSLVAYPAGIDPSAVSARIRVAIDDLADVGGMARGIALDGAPSVLYAPVGEGDGA